MNQQQMMKLRKMQKQMMEAQEKIENSIYTGTSGGGVVTILSIKTLMILTIKKLKKKVISY